MRRERDGISSATVNLSRSSLLMAAVAMTMLGAIAGIGRARGEGAPPAKEEKEQVVAPYKEAPAVSAKELLGDKFTREELAKALLVETNRVRVAHYRQALKPLRPLAEAADDQAAFLAMIGESSHYSPVKGQRTAAERVRQHGLWDVLVGENVLAMTIPAGDKPATCESVAAQLVEQWMNSPGHRANLLNRDFTHFGGAVRFAKGIGQTERSYAVQVFAKP